jgi:hypothetical protein
MHEALMVSYIVIVVVVNVVVIVVVDVLVDSMMKAQGFSLFLHLRELVDIMHKALIRKSDTSFLKYNYC